MLYLSNPTLNASTTFAFFYVAMPPWINGVCYVPAASSGGTQTLINNPIKASSYVAQQDPGLSGAYLNAPINMAASMSVITQNFDATKWSSDNV